MSRFSGPQHLGAMRDFRVKARQEAETRQAEEQKREAVRQADYDRREKELEAFMDTPDGQRLIRREYLFEALLADIIKGTTL